MMTAMAAEFDRWIADEVEELAEGYSAICCAETSPQERARLHEMAVQLVRQAETLGYPGIVEIAARLASRFDPTGSSGDAEPGDIDLQIAELRALVRH